MAVLAPILMLVVGLLLPADMTRADDRHSFGVTDEQPYESVSQSPRILDPDAIEEVQGVVTDIETVRMEDDIPFLQARLRTEEGTRVVHLGPEWYFQQHLEHFELQPDQKVQVRGSAGTLQGEAVLIAAEIQSERGDQRLRLRHEDGTPAWAAGERLPDR